MTGCSESGQAKVITLGEVVRAALSDSSQTHRLPVHHWKVLRAISACHTPALGGHYYQCAHCGKEHFVPNSCGNRHCPSCQKLNSANWLEQQVEHLLPIPYFHDVFTLPHEFNPLIQHNQQQLYSLLFSSATATLLQFGRTNLKATLGITAVLHTWSQNMLDHYHLHCVVTGGGISLDDKGWVSLGPKWQFPVKALSIVFRAKFRDGLMDLFEKGQLQFPISESGLSDPIRFARWVRRICRRKWVVYTKRPFAGPQAVLAYLCRYTHRVAITNSRFEALNLEGGTVSFRYKDYAHESQIRSMTLSLKEFLRRFCLHILPLRFVKIRNYGLLSNRDRSTRIAQARQLLAQSPTLSQQQSSEEILAIKQVEPPPLVCPYCGRPTLVLIRVVERPKRPPILDTS
jgi:putative transposase/transposase-like zinc-binding protein